MMEALSLLVIAVVEGQAKDTAIRFSSDIPAGSRPMRWKLTYYGARNYSIYFSMEIDYK
jgi:hypothetical protein